MRHLKTLLFLCFILFSVSCLAAKHPSIMLTGNGAESIRAGLSQYPLLNQSYKEVKNQADRAVNTPVVVPQPKDGGGGFTHEQHKRNYNNILNCGIAYQISQDIRYANYVRDILLDYSKKYKTWPLHPARKNNHQGGRIFWQSLNDFVWQVYVIQGYDLVYDALKPGERKSIESGLFEPIMKFFTEDCYETFNKIHNHGTWALAAVGLTGYVIDKPAYVEMSLKGSKKDGKTGYWAQLDQLFSPDGYYAEGPYYQRYAMFPFMILAKAINNFQPEQKVFEYRNKVLAKAINTCLQTTYTNGAFFPINDAIKDKTFETTELVYGVNIIYSDVNADPGLLDVAQRQKKVTLSDAGLSVAKAIEEGKARPFTYSSRWIADGNDGKQGGLGILRSGANEDQQCVVIKAGTQGMGHGHFDRLNLLYYDNDGEVFFDYGAARFLNIESKRGGHYLPENNSWAKQTIAHNTLVVNRTSHFNGDLDKAEKFHPDLIYFKNDSNLQVVAVEEKNAYAGVVLKRVTALVKVPEAQKSLMIDLFTAVTETENHYDLPFWYKGHLVDASFKIEAHTQSLKPLGTDFGYQHIWLNASNQLDAKPGYISILNNKRFYTTHFISEKPLTVQQVTTGANDPEMSLTTEKGFILSQKSKGPVSFVSVTETHGDIDPIAESVMSAKTSVSGLSLKNTGNNKKLISFSIKNRKYELEINDADKNNFIKIK